MKTTFPLVTAVPSRTIKITSWVLRILAAAAFLTAGGAKLAGVPMMVGIFDQIGIGQWFRVVTGLVEVIGGIAILVPTTAGLGGLWLAVTMFFAVLTHLFIIGGNPVPALILLFITIVVTWLHRANLKHMLTRLGLSWLSRV
ncbi:DoxX family protein [Serratia marcescens]|uniref:DoxX family protein n=1 Tax=Serratia marcescens TaxID=615 RepID=UPI0039E6E4A6